MFWQKPQAVLVEFLGIVAGCCGSENAAVPQGVVMGSSKIAMEEYMAEFPFIRRFVEEYPWISNWEIKVRVLDLEVLDSEPRAGFPLHFRYFLIGRDKSVISEVQKSRTDYSGLSLWRPSTWRGKLLSAQKVKEAITGLEKIENLLYVVAVWWFHCDHYIFIYKLPKRFDLKEFIEKERERISKEEEQTRVTVRQQIIKELADAE